MQAELKDRLLTAGMLITVTAGLLIGAHFFTFFRYFNLAVIFAVLSLCSFEVASVASNNWRVFWKGCAYLILLVAVPLGTLIGLSNNDINNVIALNRAAMFYPLLSIWFVLVVLMAIELWQKRVRLDNENSIAADIFPMLILVGIGGACLQILAVNERSSAVILWLLLVVCFADTAAYFFGKRFGVTKIAPAISPNKTVVGSLASLLTALIVGWSFRGLLGLEEQIFFAAIVAMIVGFLAQLGDFAKSSFKRKYQVKDFSQMLPGHGGILDRLDAILAAAPLICFIFLAV